MSLVAPANGLWGRVRGVLFHPPPAMDRRCYLRLAVATITVVSILASVVITLTIETFTPHPNYLQALIVAVLVPLLVAPPLTYWHHKVVYELEASRRQVEELSRTDALTGVFNRRRFFDLAARQAALSKRHDHPLSVVIMDLDHFKRINDHFGHQVGDEVLRHVAQVMQETVRETDVLARYGGEEFVLLLPHTEPAMALGMCQRLRAQVAERPLVAGGREAPVTISAGVANSRQFGHDLERLLAEADLALYEAKALGRNTCRLRGAASAGEPACAD